MLNEIRGLGDSLRSLALTVGFYALRVAVSVSDTPAIDVSARRWGRIAPCPARSGKAASASAS
jgi:hypothetical protein